MLNILFLNKVPIFEAKIAGGGEISSRYLLESLMMLGHNITLINGGHENNVEIKKVRDKYMKVVTLKTYNKFNFLEIIDFNLATLKYIKKEIDISKFDIIHGLNIDTAFVLSKLTKHVPTVITIRDMRWFCEFQNVCYTTNKDELRKCNLIRKHRCYKKLSNKKLPLVRNITSFVYIIMNSLIFTWLRHSIYSVDKIILVSHFLQSLVVNNSKIKNEKCITIYNSINTGYHQVVQEDKSNKLIVYVGALTNIHGIDMFLKIAKRISLSYPDINFVIIGDGTLRDNALNYIKKNNLKQVKLVGHLAYQQVVEYYKKASIVCYPLNFPATFGRVAIEAMANGTPVVASNIGALREIIIDGESGLLFKTGDVKDACDKILMLLESKELMKKIRKNGLAHVANNFNISKIANCHENLYFNMVKC